MAEMKSGSTAEGPYLLGMDSGTGGVRVGIFDRKGTPVVFEGVELETHHPRPDERSRIPRRGGRAWQRRRDGRWRREASRRGRYWGSVWTPRHLRCWRWTSRAESIPLRTS